MAYTLQDLREYVRAHLDLEEDELSDLLIDTWAREGGARCAVASNRWPFYESSWTVPTVAGTVDYPLANIGTSNDTPREVVAVYAADRQLHRLDRTEAERRYLPNVVGTSPPIWWSTWDDTLRLFATPSTAETLYLRGYRKPNDWVSLGAGATPDLPEDFHNTVRNWVVGCAYMQQEDTELGTTFLDLFNDELERLKKAVVHAPLARPIIMGGGPRQSILDTNGLGRLRFPFE